jgi:hypothetical protein
MEPEGQHGDELCLVHLCDPASLTARQRLEIAWHGYCFTVVHPATIAKHTKAA